MHDKGGLAGFRDLAALRAVIIRVEDEGALRPGLDLLQQDHADVGQALGIHGRQRDGVGVVGLGPGGLVQPATGDGKGIFEDAGAVAHLDAPLALP